MDEFWDRCHSCGGHFPDEPGRWARVCGECLHCWATDEDLIDHDYRWRQEMFRTNPDPIEFWGEQSPPPERKPVEDIWSCPCCAHDF